MAENWFISYESSSIFGKTIRNDFVDVHPLIWLHWANQKPGEGPAVNTTSNEIIKLVFYARVPEDVWEQIVDLDEG